MTTMEMLEEDYGRVEKAIRFIETEALRQPSLQEIASVVGLSEFHFQRLFEPVGRNQPQAVPAVPDQGVCKDPAGGITGCSQRDL